MIVCERREKEKVWRGMSTLIGRVCSDIETFLSLKASPHPQRVECNICRLSNGAGRTRRQQLACCTDVLLMWTGLKIFTERDVVVVK